MPWVEFTGNFDWRPSARCVIAYKRGMRLLVTRRCASEACAKGRAVPATRPGETADDRG